MKKLIWKAVRWLQDNKLKAFIIGGAILYILTLIFN